MQDPVPQAKELQRCRGLLPGLSGPVFNLKLVLVNKWKNQPVEMPLGPAKGSGWHVSLILETTAVRGSGEHFGLRQLTLTTPPLPHFLLLHRGP